MQVRASHRCSAHRRRLQQVVAADGLQAATDEGNLGTAVERHQFAQRVDDEDIAAGPWPLLRAPRRHAPALLAGQRLHLGKALGMPRRPQQQQVRMLLAQTAVQVDHRLLFAIMRAGRDPHRARGRYMGMELFDERLHVRRGDVELQVAQRLHLFRRRTQLHEACGVILRLCGHAGDRAQRTPDQCCQHPVAAQRSGRQARIEDVDRNATVAAAEQHVRPQLGFQDQRQAGLEVAEEAVDAARHVVRQVHVVQRIAPQRAHPFRAGRGDGGDDPADVRPLLAQRIDQRRSGVDLAHRDRMQPDPRLAARLRIGRIAFIPAPEVFTDPEAAPDQVVHGDRQQEVQHGRVQATQDPFDRVFTHAARIREPPGKDTRPGW
ncbi:hypothetical protein D3C71_1204440 [compost metagenome]